MGYLGTVASYVHSAAIKTCEASDWLLEHIGSDPFAFRRVCYHLESASQRLYNADDWVTSIEIDARNAYYDAQDAIGRAISLDNWRSQITELLNWTQGLRDNFYNMVRTQVHDLFVDFDHLLNTFDDKVRTAISDVISDLTDLKNNFEDKVRDVVSTWTWKVDDLWYNFGQKVFDTLGEDWPRLSSLIQNFPESVIDPCHGQLEGWINERRDQIYGFVTNGMEDIYERLRVEIENHIEDHAEWWFSLFERALDRLPGSD
ncbi:MAG: hypothetical protein SVV88_11630 [Pseudomonadota bacterium]|nr:hypothetical protein [Pseudomonadota bacterium]